MNLLLDNTSIHQVDRILNQNSLSVSDCLTMMRFSEQILFSDSIRICGFERDCVIERTSNTVNKLTSEVLNQESELFHVDNFTLSEYKTACDQACIDLQSELYGKSPLQIRALGKMVAINSRPTGVSELPLHDWIIKNEARSVELDQNPWEYLEVRKAFGSFDYMMLSNSRLRNATYKIGKGNAAQRLLAAKGLTILFRASVNKQLANLRNSHYSPAPARAGILAAHASDVRELLANKITSSKLRRELLASPSSVNLGLPICALFALRDCRPKNALNFFTMALERREDKDVTSMRNWLSKLSQRIETGAESELHRANHLIHDFELEARESLKQPQSFYYSLLLTISKPVLSRIFPFDPKMNEISPDLHNLLHAIQSSRRRLFLSKAIALGDNPAAAKATFFSIFHNMMA